MPNSLGAEWSFEALGTRWWLVTVRRLTSAEKKHLTSCVQAFEDAYSRFKADSYIGILNTQKRLSQFPDELTEMLTYALHMYNATNGIFNISIGAELEKSGYGNSSQLNSRVSTDLPGDVHVSTKNIEIAPWVRLDFGGFGKGWLVDKLSGLLTALGHKQHIVNGGGDIMVRGSSELLLIEDPQDDTQAIGELHLKDASLCSSSRSKRVWRDSKGKLVSHIPYKNDVAHPAPLSMHVRAKTALHADTLSTVFLLAGEKQRQALARQFSADYLIVNADRTFTATAGMGFQPYT